MLWLSFIFFVNTDMTNDGRIDNNLKIDTEMLKLMGSKDGKTATIKVSWSDNGMTVYKDGYLANYEYGIAPEEMKETYERVKENK